MNRLLLSSLLIATRISLLSAGIFSCCMSADVEVGASEAQKQPEIAPIRAEKYNWKTVTFEPPGQPKAGQVILKFRENWTNVHANRHQLTALATQAITDTLSRLFNKQEMSGEYCQQFGRLQQAVRIKKNKLIKKKPSQDQYEPSNMLAWLNDKMEVIQAGLDDPASPLRKAIDDPKSSWHKAHDKIRRWGFDRAKLKDLMGKDSDKSKDPRKVISDAPQSPLVAPAPALIAVVSAATGTAHSKAASTATTTTGATSVGSTKKIEYATIRNWLLGVTGGVLALDLLIRQKNSLVVKGAKMTGKAGKVIWCWLFGGPQPEAATEELTAEECAELAGALMEQEGLVDENPTQ